MTLLIPRYWTVKLPSQTSGASAPIFTTTVEPAFQNVRRIDLFAYTCTKNGGGNIPARIKISFTNGLHEEEGYYSETVNPGGRNGILLSLPAATTDSRFLSVPMLVCHPKENQNLTQVTIQVGDWDGNSVTFDQLDLTFQAWVDSPIPRSRAPIDLIGHLNNTGLWRDGHTD